jgi:predicted flap endonuclease-1-like 5' DNA nuclease
VPSTARSGSVTPASQSPDTLRHAGDLAAELDHARRVLASKLTELKSLETERERLLARISARDQRLRELEQKLAAGTRGEQRVAELEQKLQERDAELARLKSELEEALAWQPAVEDDLTKIKGIGPKFASALHALGVRRWADIAAWSDDDVARVAEALHVPRARIDKGGWVAAARALAG